MRDRTIILNALAVAVGAGLAACGGGGFSSAASGGTRSSSDYARLIAYAQCMRSHGANFPDPVNNGTGIGVVIPNSNSPQVQSAERACRSLAPPGPTAAQQAQNLARLLAFSRCVRAHGVPNFPDPPPNGDLNLSGTGIQKNSPQLQRAMQECRSVAGIGPAQQQAP